jgi:hypothetical protein
MAGKDTVAWAAYATLLEQITGERRLAVAVEAHQEGIQGASGALIRYCTVTHSNACGADRQQAIIVTKDATRFERQVLHLLADQGCAVPPFHMDDMTTDAREPVYMPYLEARPAQDLGHPASPLTGAIAAGLAHIHVKNLGLPPDWLPHASEDFVGRLWLYAWQERWEHNLADPEFALEFGPYTARLYAAQERLLKVLAALTAEGTTLTLLNTDLIPEDIRLWRDTPRFIDWEQAAYGTLYLDLPNYFLPETALVYRDALAACGHAIPVPEFLERYHEIGRYMGLRYLGHALEEWARGDGHRTRGRWFLYYTFKLALHGR